MSLANEIMNVLNLKKDRIETKLNAVFNLLQYIDPIQLTDEIRQES